jgi:hypothetical protein
MKQKRQVVVLALTVMVLMTIVWAMVTALFWWNPVFMRHLSR